MSKKTVNNWENDRVSAPRRSIELIEDVLAPYFRAGPPARGAEDAAAMTPEEREAVMEDMLRAAQRLAADDAIRRRSQPEDKPPERSRRAANA